MATTATRTHDSRVEAPISPASHYVIVGAGRLTVAVARRFLERGARLTVIVPNGNDLAATREAVARGAAGADHVEVVACGDSVGAALQRFCDEVSCVLALSDSGEFNIRVAVEANQCGKPVVLRAFEPTLAEMVEQRISNVRRAYSMAHLSAPFFVAAALLADDSENVLAMRGGDGYVVVTQLPVSGETSLGPGHRRTAIAPRFLSWIGHHREVRTVTDLTANGCHLLARRASGGSDWTVCPSEFPAGPDQGDVLRPGEHLLVAGRLYDVFGLLRRGSIRFAVTGRRIDARGSVVRARDRAWARFATVWTAISYSWVKWLLAAFFVLTLVIALVPRGDAADRIYTWVGTALGNTNQDISKVSKTTELLLSIGLLAGAVAFGLAICVGATFLIERRMREMMERHVKDLDQHAIVVGLNDVAYRVTEILCELGVQCAVVDPHLEVTDASAVRYVSLINDKAPVLRGELSQVLQRARVDRAFGLIGCSEDNLANLEACLRASRLGEERIRTVARIFDEDEILPYLSEWGVDRNLAAVEAAADAFVEGALYVAPVRSFALSAAPDDKWMAVRWPTELTISQEEWAELGTRGVRVIACVLRDRRLARVPADGVLEPDAEPILVGPAASLAGLIARVEASAATA